MTHVEALSQAWPHGIATYTLRRIEDAVKLGTACRQYWFRGHSEKFDSLLPAVYRTPLQSARKNIEFWAGQRFRLRARSFTFKVPGWEDHLSWLFLMQHYGVPTRLSIGRQAYLSHFILLLAIQATSLVRFGA